MAFHGVKHIVWDWNGTLFDDNHAVLAAVNGVCAAYGRDSIDLDYWRSVFCRPLHGCYERLLGRALTSHDWARLDQIYHDTYRALLPTCRLAEGVPHELYRLRGTGLGQSLLSMWFHHELVPLIDELGITDLFTRIDGLRLGVGRESKAEYLAAHLRAQNLDPADVLVIGDIVDDAAAAEHVGARCVLVTTGVMSPEALRASGAPVVDSIVDALTVLV